jgi:hypothetical protein
MVRVPLPIGCTYFCKSPSFCRGESAVPVFQPMTLSPHQPQLQPLHIAVVPYRRYHKNSGTRRIAADPYRDNAFRTDIVEAVSGGFGDLCGSSCHQISGGSALAGVLVTPSQNRQQPGIRGRFLLV